MAEWRIGRGWTEAELAARLAHARTLGRNFDDAVDAMTQARGWRRYYSEAVIARLRPGPAEDDGAFTRGRTAIANYAFSDPRIVLAHFEADGPLLGRPMLLEMRAFRVLHYLGGVVVGDVREEADDDQTVFGFRYDTLEGHIERGVEWFLLTLDHATGALRFRIEAAWRPGDFPNAWSRLGFALVGPYYQRAWHRRAHARMARLVRGSGPDPVEPGGNGLVHAPPDVIFKRLPADHV